MEQRIGLLLSEWDLAGQVIFVGGAVQLGAICLIQELGESKKYSLERSVPSMPTVQQDSADRMEVSRLAHPPGMAGQQNAPDVVIDPHWFVLV